MIITALFTIVSLIILILSGVHIVFALAVMSFVGVWMMTGKISIALSLLATTAFEGIRDYSYAVLPLFVLMGSLMGASGAAKDLFGSANLFLKKLPGGMGVATVAANAVFAAVTGVSVASAAVFSRICLPEMKRYNYDLKFALGTVAGSSVLGMLIPPSVLMIVYGMITGESIGKLFVAGIIPGLLLALLYSVGIIVMGIIKPELIGRKKRTVNEAAAAAEQGEETYQEEKPWLMVLKSLPVFFLVFLVLGGIWGGLFTPTEASGVGALGAIVLAFSKKITRQQFKGVFLETSSTTATILFLLITAQMYSRMLSMSGLVTWLGNLVVSAEISQWAVLFLFCLLLLILGCFLDSASILLLTVPLVLPIAVHFQWNLIWLGIVVIMVTEMGLMTPPFGMVVFAMKATVGDEVAVEDIFMGSLPFLLLMAAAVIFVIAFPALSTWLPSLM